MGRSGGPGVVGRAGDEERLRSWGETSEASLQSYSDFRHPLQPFSAGIFRRLPTTRSGTVGGRPGIVARAR
jgi:hypothetical protein